MTQTPCLPWLRLLVTLAVKKKKGFCQLYRLFSFHRKFITPWLGNEMLLQRYQVPSRRKTVLSFKDFYLKTISRCSPFYCFAITSLVYINLGSTQVQLPRILEHNISMYLGYSIIACQDLPRARISCVSVVFFFLRKEKSGVLCLSKNLLLLQGHHQLLRTCFTTSTTPPSAWSGPHRPTRAAVTT